MRLKVIFLISVVLFFCSTATNAEVTIGSSDIIIGGSNFTFLNEYPKPKCTKPRKPLKPNPPLFNDTWTIDNYKMELMAYKSDLLTYKRLYGYYIDCVNKYIENANYDIKRIQMIQKDLVKEAERDF